MTLPDQLIVRLAVALGVGILIGIERERSKGQGADREVAGVRTFTLTALTGAISLLLGGPVVFAVFAALLGLLIAVGYGRTRERDPGLTTEVAMLTTFLLGGLAMDHPQLSAAVAVVVTVILASRSKVHGWIHNVLTDQEVRDGLMLAAAALVVLPVIPDRAIDPWGALHPRKLWMLAVLIMAINGLGYIALRALGARIGLAVAGLFSGFVSSTATVGAMGSLTRKHAELHRGAVAGAAASSVATVVQLALVVGLVSMPTLAALWPSLIGSGVAALAYAAIFMARSVRDGSDTNQPRGRPFDPKTAVVFVLVVGITLLLSALLTQWLGDRGLLIASAVSGFSDAHATAISAASLAAGGTVGIRLAAIAVLIGFTTNAISKAVVAFSLGERRYAFELLPGLALMVGGAWTGWVFFGSRMVNGE